MEKTVWDLMNQNSKTDGFWVPTDMHTWARAAGTVVAENVGSDYGVVVRGGNIVVYRQGATGAFTVYEITPQGILDIYNATRRHSKSMFGVNNGAHYRNVGNRVVETCHGEALRHANDMAVEQLFGGQ